MAASLQAQQHGEADDADISAAEAEPCLSLELSLGGRSSSAQPSHSSSSSDPKQNSPVLLCSAMAAARACSFFHEPPTLNISTATVCSDQPSNNTSIAPASCSNLNQQHPLVPALTLWNHCSSTTADLDHNLTELGSFKRKESCPELMYPKQKRSKAASSCATRSSASAPIGLHCNDPASDAAVASCNIYGGGMSASHLHKAPMNAAGLHPDYPLQAPKFSLHRGVDNLLLEGSSISILPSAAMHGPKSHIHEVPSRHDLPAAPAMKQRLASLIPAELEGSSSCQSTISSEELEMSYPKTNVLGKNPISAMAKFSCLAAKNSCNAISIDVDSSDHEQSSTCKNMNELESPQSRCGSNSDILGSVDSSVANQNMPTSICSSMQNMPDNCILSSVAAAPAGPACLWPEHSRRGHSGPSSGYFKNPFLWGSSLMSSPSSISKLPDAGGGCASTPPPNQSARQSTQRSTTTEEYRPACELSLGPCPGKSSGPYHSRLVRQPLMAQEAMPELAVDNCSSSVSCKASFSFPSDLTKKKGMPQLLQGTLRPNSQMNFKEWNCKMPSPVRKADADEGSMKIGVLQQKSAKTVRFCGVDTYCVQEPTSKGGRGRSSQCMEKSMSMYESEETGKSESLSLGKRDVQAPCKAMGSSSNIGFSCELGAAATSCTTSKERSQLPCVSTTCDSENGKTIYGVMYITEKMQARLVCSCHGVHMTPAEFVQHSGSTDLSNPERRIVVEYLPFAGGLTSTPPPNT